MTQLVLPDQGVDVNEAKVQAVENDTKRQDAAEVRSFLGSVNSCVKFIPYLAMISG